MKNHTNIEWDETIIPAYALHDDGKICGFFGSFRFLSNFYPLETGVCLDELYFPTVEHAYQAAKYPPEDRTQFININAGQSKKLGANAPKFNASKWNKKKYSIMESLVRQKFVNNFKLKQMLLMTDGCHLEETNSWGDQYWGTNIQREGENNLGKILMIVRDELKLKEKDKF
jgi:ribA/ribD-fused uncharacterized protein